MTDKLKSMTEAWHKRQQRHRHNGFLGSVKMAEVNFRSMIDYPTTTQETRLIARRILSMFPELQDSLKRRRDGT